MSNELIFILAAERNTSALVKKDLKDRLQIKGMPE